LFATPETRGNVIKTGPVGPLADYYRAADLAICPVEFGGGTKVKLIEALAAGLPTVAFEESVHGTEFLDGKHLIVAEKSTESLVRGLRSFFVDRELANRLSREARAVVVGKHDWKKLSLELEGALLRLAETSKGNGTGG
jgi:glycosyltransferase involved in cell wall biosynthesis